MTPLKALPPNSPFRQLLPKLERAVNNSALPARVRRASKRQLTDTLGSLVREGFVAVCDAHAPDDEACIVNSGWDTDMCAQSRKHLSANVCDHAVNSDCPHYS